MKIKITELKVSGDTEVLEGDSGRLVEAIINQVVLPAVKAAIES